jgi:hypothetical protein
MVTPSPPFACVVHIGFFRFSRAENGLLTRPQDLPLIPPVLGKTELKNAPLSPNFEGYLHNMAS